MRTDLRIGAEFAGYRLEAQLGRGGMGVVYLADEQPLARKVAIKLLAPELAEDEAFRTRFLRESRLAASLEHPNIIPIYRAGEEEGLLFLAMRYVDGDDLQTLIKREGPMPATRVVPLLRQLASALDEAHGRGLVHRDVKPANVLLAGDHAYLTDFGLTRGATSQSMLTKTGQVIGTLPYLAPEQIEGLPPAPAGDLYAFACLAFQSLTGDVPFPREFEAAVLYAHLREPPPALVDSMPDLAGLDPVFTRALAKSPEDRFASCADLVIALESALAGKALPAQAPPKPAHPLGVEEERKTVTALCAAIVGSTAEAPDPEDMRATLPEFQSRVRAEVERFGGALEGVVGEAMVALFGVPAAHEDDPARAVSAAFAVKNAIAELAAAEPWPELGVRVGVTTGEALVTIGGTSRDASSVAGVEAMNAATLNSAVPVGAILVDARTHDATRELFEFEEREPVALAGNQEPTSVWEAVALKQRRPRRVAAEHALVGRREELDRLRELWADVRRARARAAATVLGSAGIGKSRLLGELAEYVRQDGRVFWGHCLPYGEGITYWPIAETFKTAAGILVSDDARATARKIGVLIEDLGADPDELRTITAALGNLLGTPAAPGETPEVAEISQAELHWGIRRTFELLADKQPTVVVFEDLHWADPTLLELLELIGQGAARVPLLILGSARTELLESQPGLLTASGYRHVLQLEPLSEEESERLLGQLVGVSVDHGGAVQALLRNAGGNPLYLEETVRMLRDESLLDAHGRLQEAELDALPVPNTLQALIGSRLDRLPPEEKLLAKHAAVVGGVFWPGALLHMDGFRGDLLESLQGLERRDLVREHERSTIAGEREYSFKHILIRDVAYGRLAKGRRAALHVRFADWVGALPGTSDELVEIVAWHLEQACALARSLKRSPIPPPVAAAVDALTRAGEMAERREGMREADRFYARALELIEEEDAEARAALTLRRSRILVWQRQLSDASGQLAEVADEALRLGRRDLRGEALVALAGLDHWSGKPAADGLLEAEAIALELGDRALEVKVLFKLAQERWWFEGIAEAAVAHLRRASAIADELDDRSLRIEAHMQLGTLLLNVGELADADSEFLAAIALAGETGSQRQESLATTLLGFVQYYRGRPEEAERLALQALEWLDRTGDAFLQIQNLRMLAKYALAADNPEVAEEHLQRALPLALERGGFLVTQIYRQLIETLVHEGRVDDARRLLAFAEADLPEEDPYARSALLVAQALVAAAERDQGSATDAFVQALRLLERQTNPSLIDLAEARMLFARALGSFGDSDAAEREFRAAREIFARMEAQALLAEIDAELAALTPRSDEAGTPV